MYNNIQDFPGHFNVTQLTWLPHSIQNQKQTHFILHISNTNRYNFLIGWFGLNSTLTQIRSHRARKLTDT